LLQTEDILRLSHKVAQSGHWYVRLDDNTLFWSEEVFRLHGMSPNATHPTVDSALNFYHPNERDRVEALLNETIKTGNPLSFEARIVRTDGEVRWVEALGELKSSPYSNNRYLFGVFRDITENQEQRLHNQRLAWVMENSQEIILMTDSAGSINWANSAFENITGYSLEEACGQNPVTCFRARKRSRKPLPICTTACPASRALPARFSIIQKAAAPTGCASPASPNSMPTANYVALTPFRRISRRVSRSASTWRPKSTHAPGLRNSCDTLLPTMN